MALISGGTVRHVPVSVHPLVYAMRIRFGTETLVLVSVAQTCALLEVSWYLILACASLSTEQ